MKTDPTSKPKMSVAGLSAGFNLTTVLHDISLSLHDGEVLAILGPSGCGKSTMLRCLNRMHDTAEGAWVKGAIHYDEQDIHRGLDTVELRRKVGMVFQRPNPFPTMSIRENVMAGFTLVGERRQKSDEGVVEQSLRRAALWDEVKDRLDVPGTSLSGGQQQRLCIARALAVQPDVLLMDEPCSALDPVATAHIEDLILALRGAFTIAIVTHNLGQARRVGTRAAFLLGGALIEEGSAAQVLDDPHDPRTRDYVAGRFG